MSLYHDRPRLVPVRSKQDRTATARTETPDQGLTPCEKQRLRDRGFTELDIDFLDRLEQINRMVRESEERT